jgi:hypothetical protein
VYLWLGLMSPTTAPIVSPASPQVLRAPIAGACRRPFMTPDSGFRGRNCMTFIASYNALAIDSPASSSDCRTVMEVSCAR